MNTTILAMMTIGCWFSIFMYFFLNPPDALPIIRVDSVDSVVDSVDSVNTPDVTKDDDGIFKEMYTIFSKGHTLLETGKFPTTRAYFENVTHPIQVIMHAEERRHADVYGAIRDRITPTKYDKHLTLLENLNEPDLDNASDDAIVQDVRKIYSDFRDQLASGQFDYDPEGALIHIKTRVSMYYGPDKIDGIEAKHATIQNTIRDLEDVVTQRRNTGKNNTTSD